MNNDTGIYTITSPSGGQYVGSAKSFKTRWAVHLGDLRRGTHHSSALQNAWNKYGEGAMTFAKIALCPITDLLAVEQARIDALRPEYNIEKIAGSSLGTRRSDATRAKLSKAKKGKKLTIEHRAAVSRALSQRTGERRSAEARANIAAAKVGEKNPRARAVICIETGQRFISGQAAIDWLRANGRPKASHGHIYYCCQGKIKSSFAYGYHWRYAD
ncbi:GIY-YIG nuclease family protein [Paraburkholderia elongata]|uniref:GIY-YIG domain-containing protein n=1 Tax=Paraburkholderia elongata TaxID=2675747 RepID=A0A972NVE9_9BURK|nr:GIY-YIG nuclease family protein [Paraburkholderia elongata]NPT59104.1 hypothetical protein [Paraburkholderia elongata]